MGTPELGTDAAKGNLIGHEARVANEARVAGIAKARNGPRGIGVRKTGHVALMKHVNHGSGRLGVKKRCPTSLPATHRGMDGALSHRRPQAKELNISS